MTDTIVAISSALAPALRGILRISGPEAFSIISDYYNRPLTKTIYQRTSGKLWIQEWKTTIDATLYLMKAPYSYTREDVVEIHTFSSLVLLNRLLKQFIDAGAKPATPGEFTQRAFMAGRIDLAQVESIQMLINASTDAERRLAMWGVSGELSSNFSKISDKLAEVISLLEAYIDFVEEDIGELPQQECLQTLQMAMSALENLTANTNICKSSQVSVCLYGLPNAGKSSLFNCLLQKQAAIVTNIPGTTLDWLQGIATIAGINFKIVDMPGIMANPSKMQTKAQDKVEELLKGADLILYVIDGSQNFSNLHFQLWKQLPEVPTLFLRSKSDLALVWSTEIFRQYSKEFADISVHRPESWKKLRNWLAAHGRQRCHLEPGLINMRQYYVALEAKQAIQRAIQALQEDISYEFIAVDIRQALTLIGELVGEVTTEDILDRIFSGFCIGK